MSGTREHAHDAFLQIDHVLWVWGIVVHLRDDTSRGVQEREPVCDW